MKDTKPEPSLDELTQELACLHRQVVSREPCPHHPKHEDLKTAVARILSTPGKRGSGSGPGNAPGRPH